MNTNLATVAPASESTALAPDLVLMRAPEVVLAEAHRAARALTDVLEKKARKIVISGETYLEFEDWQTLGRFYGVTAKVMATEFVEVDGVKGFTARAVAVRSDGFELSAAEASCLTDEERWRTRPWFQLKSMAQTRACAKVLRNVLSWIVVLAGYRTTPAEEVVDHQTGEVLPPASKAPRRTEPILEVTVKILSIVKRAVKEGVQQKFVISADDQQQYHTFSITHATDAKAAQQAGVPVAIRYKDTKFGRMIQTLEEVVPDVPEPPL